MAAMREGCAAALDLLAREGRLADGWSVGSATDLLCAMLSFEGWDRLTGHCGWTGPDYAGRLQRAAADVFIARAA